MRPGPIAPIVIDDPQTIAWLHGVMEVIASSGHSLVPGTAGIGARGCASKIHTAVEEAMPWTKGLGATEWREEIA